MNELQIQLPLEALIKLIPEFAEEGSLFKSKHQFTAHLLKNHDVYISLLLDPNDDNELLMDKFTSSVIKRGGTFKTSRNVLDSISPYLAKRITGEGSLDLQQSIKELFDPNDILNRSSLF